MKNKKNKPKFRVAEKVQRIGFSHFYIEQRGWFGFWHLWQDGLVYFKDKDDALNKMYDLMDYTKVKYHYPEL
jgi:hypothetical protein